MASSAIIMPDRHHGWPVSSRAGAFPQYQGGSSFTVFSAQGSNPTSNCKVCGKSVQKIYDKSVKGYVYSCAGGMASKLQLPKDDSKSGLQLVQPFLVLQIFVPQGQHFSFELRVTDTTNTRRKMYFSTSFSELKTTPLHSQIPLSMVLRNTWLSLAVHVSELFYSCFRVMSFRSVDVIILGAVCKIRKIFTMRNRLAELPGHALANEEWLPPEHIFAIGVDASIQVLDSEKLHLLGAAINLEGRREGVLDSVASARTINSNKLDRSVHIAFGSRVSMPLSTMQINANFSRDEKLLFSKDRKPKSIPFAVKRHTKSDDIKGFEPTTDCCDRTVTVAFMKQTGTKHLDLGVIDRSETLHSSLTFPIHEEPYTITEMENIISEKKACSVMADVVKKGEQLGKRKDSECRAENCVAVTVEKEHKDIHIEENAKEQKHSETLDPSSEQQSSGWGRTFDVGQYKNFVFSQHSSGELAFINQGKLPFEKNAPSIPFDHLTGGLGTSFEDAVMDDSDDAYSERSKQVLTLTEQDWSSPYLLKENQFSVKDSRSCDVGQCYFQQRDISQEEKHAGIGKEWTEAKECCADKEATLKRSHSNTEEFWIVHEEDDFDEYKCATNSAGSVDPQFLDNLENTIPEDTSSVITGSSDITTCCLSPYISRTNLPSNLKKIKDGFEKINATPYEADITFYNEREKDLSKFHPKLAVDTESDDMQLDLLYDPVMDCYYDPKANRYYELK